MEQPSVGTPVHDQNEVIGRVLAVDDDPESRAIAILVQGPNGDLRRLAPGTFHIVDGVVVVDGPAAREAASMSVAPGPPGR